MRIYPERLKYAVLALSYFRSRHDRRLRYRKSKRHAGETVAVYREHARLARHYIAQARAFGWRGSVVTAVMEGQR